MIVVASFYEKKTTTIIVDNFNSTMFDTVSNTKKHRGNYFLTEKEIIITIIANYVLDFDEIIDKLSFYVYEIQFLAT